MIVRRRISPAAQRLIDEDRAGSNASPLRRELLINRTAPIPRIQCRMRSTSHGRILEQRHLALLSNWMRHFFRGKMNIVYCKADTRRFSPFATVC